MDLFCHLLVAPAGLQGTRDDHGGALLRCYIYIYISIIIVISIVIYIYIYIIIIIN